MQDGIVEWFESGKGFGFISSRGKDFFVHYRDIQGDGFKSLKKGERVTFEAGESLKGPVATQVKVQTD
jgi:CspA family cold shock protein